LPAEARQFKGLFVAVPQIEHIWTAQRPGTPKT
jgi:hypothetical protein